MGPGKGPERDKKGDVPEMRNRKLLFVGVLAVTILAMSSVAFAQAEQKDKTVGDVIKDGGAIGFLIIGMSVAALALTIEHIITIRRDKIVPPELIDELEALFEEEEYQEALELCESEPNFLTNILSAGLPKINAGFDAMEKAMDEVSEEETIKLQQKISWLNLIANIAPMMGLLGTVGGMISAFNTITKLGANVTPADLSSGISAALVTTMLGLIVAIPTMAVFFYFRNKVIKVSLELAAIADDLVERFRPQQQ
jgi:biopolymer transport protein ExbB